MIRGTAGASPAPRPGRPRFLPLGGVPRTTRLRSILKLFDVRGRLVRLLVREHFDAGTHRVQWDGLDERGGVAPAAIYFARIEAGGSHAVQKWVHLRR